MIRQIKDFLQDAGLYSDRVRYNPEENFEKSAILTEENACTYFESKGFNLNSSIAKENMKQIERLLRENRCHIYREPGKLCQTAIAKVSGSHNLSENGLDNVEYLQSIAENCKNPGNIYTEEYFDGFTQKIIAQYHCIEHFSVHDDNFLEKRYMVIGESQNLYH